MWNNFEHQIWKKIKNYELEKKRLLLTVSGGVDSMVLVEVFCRLNLQKNMTVLHFHHGDFENKIFRDQAQKTIEDYCLAQNLRLISQKATEKLVSEAQYRDARRAFFLKHKTLDSIFVTGHHLDDVLETRLLKMIRGVGPEGLVAFQDYNAEIFRPLLDFSKAEIFDYANQNELRWTCDPTNEDSIFLRNWLRNEWLPALNLKLPGGVSQFAKSLELLLQQKDPFIDRVQYLDSEVIIERMWFFGLTTKDQLKVLSKCVSHFKNIEFSSGNLREINKRLDKNQKEHIFDILGMNWVINVQQIMVRYVDYLT